MVLTELSPLAFIVNGLIEKLQYTSFTEIVTLLRKNRVKITQRSIYNVLNLLETEGLIIRDVDLKSEDGRRKVLCIA